MEPGVPRANAGKCTVRDDATTLKPDAEAAEKSGYGISEAGEEARILRTDVLPMCNWRALAALLAPRAESRLTCRAWRRAVGGRPCGRPSLRAWAIPALTRSRRISRSNSAKTANNPASARPVGVVRSKASVKEMKPTSSSASAFRVPTRSANDRPHRSSRHTRMAAISRRRAACMSSSRCGRSLRTPHP